MNVDGRARVKEVLVVLKGSGAAADEEGEREGEM